MQDSGAEFLLSDQAIGRISFVFWTYYLLRSVLIGLLFSSDASVGTFVAFAMTFAFFFVLILVALHSRRLRLYPSFGISGAVVAYTAWSGLSVFWSYAEPQYVAGFYWVSGVLDMAVVLLLFSLGNRKVVFEESLKGLIFGGFVLVLIIVLLLDVQSDGRVGAELVHINTIGAQLGIASVCCLYFLSQFKSRFWFVTFAFLCIGLISTFSKTSIAGFSIALVLFFLLARGARGTAITLFAILFTSIWWLSSEIEAYIGTYIYSGGNDFQTATETLSGRTILWADTWYMIKDAWLIGYGLSSFRDVGPDVFSIRVPHAHNELLHQWFSLGIVGLLLACLVYVRAARYWWKCRKLYVDFRGNASMVGLALLAYSTTRGITEASAAWLVFPLPLLLSFLLSQTNWRGKQPQKIVKGALSKASTLGSQHALHGTPTADQASCGT